MARAATTNRSVIPSMPARKARRTKPALRSVSCGNSAPRATGSVLFSRALGGVGGLLGALLGAGGIRIPVGARRGGVLRGGLLGALLAVIGGVEARALERDAGRVEDLPDRRAALHAGGKRVFGQLLHHVKDVTVLALVLVDRHSASSKLLAIPGLYSLEALGHLSGKRATRGGG